LRCGRSGGFALGGLDFAEGLDGLVEGAAVGVHAPLELGEDLGIVGADLSEGESGMGFVALLMDEVIELGLGAAKAAEVPGAVDDFVHVLARKGSGGFVIGVVACDEFLVLGRALTREDFGLGVESGFEGVHG
jgi:hypothetical protein